MRLAGGLEAIVRASASQRILGASASDGPPMPRAISARPAVPGTHPRSPENHITSVDRCRGRQRCLHTTLDPISNRNPARDPVSLMCDRYSTDPAPILSSCHIGQEETLRRRTGFPSRNAPPCNVDTPSRAAATARRRGEDRELVVVGPSEGAPAHHLPTCYLTPTE